MSARLRAIEEGRHSIAGDVDPELRTYMAKQIERLDPNELFNSVDYKLFEDLEVTHPVFDKA